MPRRPTNRLFRTLAVVTHAEREKAIEVSRDGNPAFLRWLPKRFVSIDPTTRQPFIAITIPEWLAKAKALSEHHSELTDKRVWTPDEKLAWDWARSVARKIRSDARKLKHQQAIGPSVGRNYYA